MGYAVHINGVQTLCVSLEELDVSEAAAELVSSPAQDARMLVVTDARHDIRFMKTPGCSCDQPHEPSFPRILVSASLFLSSPVLDSCRRSLLLPSRCLLHVPSDRSRFWTAWHVVKLLEAKPKPDASLQALESSKPKQQTVNHSQRQAFQTLTPCKPQKLKQSDPRSLGSPASKRAEAVKQVDLKAATPKNATLPEKSSLNELQTGNTAKFYLT